jgi:hypothetical protein
VFRRSRHPRNASQRLVENREERRAGYFRHLFAYGEMSIGRSRGFVKCEFSTLRL